MSNLEPEKSHFVSPYIYLVQRVEDVCNTPTIRTEVLDLKDAGRGEKVKDTIHRDVTVADGGGRRKADLDK